MADNEERLKIQAIKTCEKKINTCLLVKGLCILAYLAAFGMGCYDLKKVIFDKELDLLPIVACMVPIFGINWKNSRTLTNSIKTYREEKAAMEDKKTI